MLIRTATAPNLEDDKALDELIRTDGWQTLMTFARESARKSFSSVPVDGMRPTGFSAQRPPGGQFPATSGHQPMDTDDIPPEVFDQIARESGGAPSGASNVRICPHCTFENTHSGTDCEICGLPL